VSFEEKASEAMTAKSGDRGKIRYYRNPMGLPDTSPTPKKDSMGMDYLPVYEGEQDDDSSVKVSAGKLQKAGVQTEVAERRTLSTVVRAAGTIQEDDHESPESLFGGILKPFRQHRPISDIARRQADRIRILYLSLSCEPKKPKYVARMPTIPFKN
jgi:hypothetical protein